MIVKFHGTPDELEYTVRMLIESLSRVERDRGEPR